jgi:hypothetical protein
MWLGTKSVFVSKGRAADSLRIVDGAPSDDID